MAAAPRAGALLGRVNDVDALARVGLLVGSLLGVLALLALLGTLGLLDLLGALGFLGLLGTLGALGLMGMIGIQGALGSPPRPAKMIPVALPRGIMLALVGPRPSRA